MYHTSLKRPPLLKKKLKSDLWWARVAPRVSNLAQLMHAEAVLNKLFLLDNKL
jgi:hypothetical protein